MKICRDRCKFERRPRRWFMNARFCVSMIALLTLVADLALRDRPAGSFRPGDGAGEIMEGLEGDCVSFARSIVGEKKEPAGNVPRDPFPNRALSRWAFDK